MFVVLDCLKVEFLEIPQSTILTLNQANISAFNCLGFLDLEI